MPLFEGFGSPSTRCAPAKSLRYAPGCCAIVEAPDIARRHHVGATVGVAVGVRVGVGERVGETVEAVVRRRHVQFYAESTSLYDE
jgi:hypothetical protein